MTYTQGDKVRLKSGGPVLTVTDVVEDRVGVTWTDNQGAKHAEEYRAEMLTSGDGAAG